MGVILQGILGGFSGKVGPVVGGKWKDINYMRGYVTPANPNTSNQQIVRTKFKNLVEHGRLLVASILQPFWDMFYTNMSGFNAWISQNYALSSSVGQLDENAIMSKGTLENLQNVSATYSSGTGVLSVTYDDTINSNGLSTDEIAVVVYNIETEFFTFQIGVVTRGDGTTDVQLAPGLTYSDVIAYAFAYRGSGSELIVSDSLGAVAASA